MEDRETIGIVGGGQLGRMLTLAALPLGFRVVVINPTPNSPAAQVGAEELVADLYDPSALAKLAEQSDYITVEIEHLDTKTLDMLASRGAQINPAPKTIKLIQDKFLQKKFLRNASLPVAPFMKIDNKASAMKALDDFGGKMLIKSRHGAYDGRGNMLVRNNSDLAKALKTFAGQALYAEAYINFDKELAVSVAKSTGGNTAIYPVVETIHQRNICIEVLAPARISQKQQQTAQKMALKTIKLLDGAGVFTIEMFLTNDGQVLINEIAPRVHNSGHYTIEASRTSQFEQHIRAIAGLPLGDVSMAAPAAVMVNILGEKNGPTRLTGLKTALSEPSVNVHIYGKFPTKVDRKMGHITATGKSLAEVRKRARLARKQLSI